MDPILVEHMRDYMSSKSTDELVKIWGENDRAKHVEETFEAIRQILEERGETIPPQLPIQKERPMKKKHKMEREHGGFFSFRTMISPIVIKVIYVLGMLGITIGGIVMIEMGLHVAGLNTEKLNIFGVQISFNKQIVMGIALIVLGNIGWRLLCEGWILLFRIRDILGSIETHLKRERREP